MNALVVKTNIEADKNILSVEANRTCPPTG